MRNRNEGFLLLFAVLILGVIFTQITPCLGQIPRPNRPPFRWDFTPEDWERLRNVLPVYFTVKGVIASISSVLLLVIVWIHIGIYRETGAKFSLGLVAFSTALLLYTISSNPLVHNLLGFRRIGFGPLFIIPDALTLIASAVLIYLSRQ